MIQMKRTLPTFRTDQEEREFWRHHSVEAFADTLNELDVVIQPARTEQIAVRLRPEDVKVLRTVAKQKGVGHTTLARSIVEQRIGRWQQQTHRARSTRRRRAA
jgi:hypothetical protein